MVRRLLHGQAFEGQWGSFHSDLMPVQQKLMKWSMTYQVSFVPAKQRRFVSSDAEWYIHMK